MDTLDCTSLRAITIQNTYFTANCSTLAGAVVGPSGVALVVAEPNVLLDKTDPAPALV
jgi:hypothetical protein